MEELEKSSGFPSRKRVLEGPVAVIECVQEIPCDVCGSACPYGAIEVAHIRGLPKLMGEKCKGCGLCLPSCPGLAIFLVDYNFSKDEALISFPYEFLPTPKVGEEVHATDRLGHAVTMGRVVKIMEKGDFAGTGVVSIAVPKEWVRQVRGIKLARGEGQAWGIER